MGCESSVDASAPPLDTHQSVLDADDYAVVVAAGKKFHLSRSMMAKLPSKFGQADFDGTHDVDFEEFRRLLDLEKGPLLKSLWKTCDRDHSREIDFVEFINGMAEVGGLRSEEDKIRYAFKFYDVNRTGHLQKNEFLEVMADPNVHMNMTKKQLDGCINSKTCKNPEAVTEREFYKAVKSCPRLMMPAETIITKVRERVFNDGDGWNRSNAEESFF